MFSATTRIFNSFIRTLGYNTNFFVKAVSHTGTALDTINTNTLTVGTRTRNSGHGAGGDRCGGVSEYRDGPPLIGRRLLCPVFRLPGESEFILINFVYKGTASLPPGDPDITKAPKLIRENWSLFKLGQGLQQGRY